jgi:hypothetical protein
MVMLSDDRPFRWARVSFRRSSVAVSKGRYAFVSCFCNRSKDARFSAIFVVITSMHLKMEAGCRDVDVHPGAAAILRNFIGNQTSAFLFQTGNGTMFDPGNIDRDTLGPILEETGRDDAGTRFNIFRRFREAALQRSDVRQILIDYWMGHASASMGDRYGKQLVEDVEYRQEQVKKVGLSFEPPPSLLGLRGLQTAENVVSIAAA